MRLLQLKYTQYKGNPKQIESMDNLKLLRTFLEDPLIKEKYKLDDKKINEIDLKKDSNILLIDLIKEAVIFKEDGKSDDDVVRNLKIFLNNRSNEY